MTIRRISEKELRKVGRPGAIAEAPPAGIPPLLRASWKFARDMARRFSRELLKDHADEFIKNLVKRFT